MKLSSLALVLLIPTSAFAAKNTITWQDGGPSNIPHGFNVYRQTVASCPTNLNVTSLAGFTKIMGSIPSGQLSYVDTSLANSTTFEYVVTSYATSGAGESLPSVAVCGTTPALQQVPNPPNNVTVTPSN